MKSINYYFYFRMSFFNLNFLFLQKKEEIWTGAYKIIRFQGSFSGTDKILSRLNLPLFSLRSLLTLEPNICLSLSYGSRTFLGIFRRN